MKSTNVNQGSVLYTLSMNCMPTGSTIEIVDPQDFPIATFVNDTA